jgi:membrane protein YdbS with pleckstrin-like domain
MEDPEPSPEAVALLDPSEPDAPPAVQAPPSVADGVEHPLDHRAITVRRIVGWITTASFSLGLLAVIYIILLAASPPGWVTALLLLAWACVTAVLGWFLHTWPEVEHRHASYKVDEQGIEIRRGVVWRLVINVPRSRVQHTDVSQGPLERSHGLGTLVVYTAGTDHAKVNLHGLDHATALRIRDHLLPGDSRDAV